MQERSQEYSATTERHTAQPSDHSVAVVREGFLECLGLSQVLAKEKQLAKRGMALACLGGRVEFSR